MVLEGFKELWINDRKSDDFFHASLRQHQERLRQEREALVAKQKAAEIIAQAQRRAGEIVDEAKGDARVEGERILEAARVEVDQEMNRAREALRGEVARLAVAGAEKIIRREIDASAQAGLIDELVTQI